MISLPEGERVYVRSPRDLHEVTLRNNIPHPVGSDTPFRFAEYLDFFWVHLDEDDIILLPTETLEGENDDG